MPTDAHNSTTTRAQVLATLRSSDQPKTVAEIADELDVHPNTVRFNLDTLLERGQAEQVHTQPRGPGRPALRVRAVATMDPAGPRHYRALAEVMALDLAGEPDATARAGRAGRTWGARIGAGEPAEPAVDPVSRLTGVLEDLGFAPEHEATEIQLRHCPFLEVARSSGNVVCAIHEGMMQGLLDSLDSNVTIERLEPFARPDVCIAHLRGEEKAS